MQTQEQDRKYVLGSAVRNGVVDTALDPINSFLVSSLLRSARRKKEHYQNINSFEPYQHPKSAKWQVGTMETYIHPDLSDAACVEVARFVVPKGQVGFVQYIEQVVNDYQGRYYPTNKEYWGSPNFVIPDVDNIRWWLKIDFYDGTEPARFVYNQNAAFGSEVAPGMPYSEMATIDALWYPAHNNRRLKLMVPGNRMLRFYYYSPSLVDYGWVVRGRLSGYLQSTYCDEAMENAREI